MSELESAVIGAAEGTEIELGDLLAFPVSRAETISHLEVIGIDKNERDGGAMVYLRHDDQRYTLYTGGDRLGFGTLEGETIDPTPILGIEIVARRSDMQDPDGPMLEDLLGEEITED